MGLNLETKIGEIVLKNPVLVASGTFGYAKEFEKLIDLKKLGGIVTKTITIKPRLGNPPVRIVETPSGMLNAIGLQNVGVEKFISDKLPYLKKLGIPIITSVMGYSLEEFAGVLAALKHCDEIAGFELNLSCPNVPYGTKSQDGLKMFAHDAELIKKVVAVARQTTSKTLIVKLGPDVSDIAAMAKAAEEGGADAVSLINTFIAMAIDVNTRKPVLANKTGGLSGPCIRPVAVRMTYDAAQAVQIPVIGIGGIMTAHDALEFLIAGASAVQVGTATFTNPSAPIEVIDGLKDFMKKEKIQKLSALIGSLHV